MEHIAYTLPATKKGFWEMNRATFRWKKNSLHVRKSFYLKCQSVNLHPWKFKTVSDTLSVASSNTSGTFNPRCSLSKHVVISTCVVIVRSGEKICVFQTHLMQRTSISNTCIYMTITIILHDSKPAHILVSRFTCKNDP